MSEEKQKGLIIVYTGPGKGKTTAAMGMALRGVGHHLKSLMIQFIKGSWKYGELEAVKALYPYFEIFPMGKGFIHIGKPGPEKEDVEAVSKAWECFEGKVSSKEYDMIILDEINVALNYGLLPLGPVLQALHEKPAGLHLVLTGRNAPPEIMDMADLVTEMVEVKHPYNNGVPAQKGVEF
jgi:cob(I)alamin adenosyltransferase